MDKSRFIFKNEMTENVYRKAKRKKAKYLRKYGGDHGVVYHLSSRPVPDVGELLGIRNIVTSSETGVQFDEKSIIIGNIRMGFGHYRISMALASAAKAMGYEPYWFDLHSFQDAACGKIIAEQNRMYSLGSKLSQKIPVFNKFVWEPLNSEGFRQLSYNSSDQKTAELMTSVFHDIPKDIPFVAAHVWPSQAAVHAGLKNVINAVPDNWPMALHLSEGAVHTVQTPSSYIGYRALRGMDWKRQLKPMPKGSVVYTGHYVDHELVANIEADCAKRLDRIKNGKPRRWLLTVGGAGAQKKLISAIIRRFISEVKRDRAVLMINVGDHIGVWRELEKEIPEMRPFVQTHFNDFSETVRFCNEAYDNDITGIHVFSYSDIFAAVYSTNILMRITDVLITKPGELSFYPVPKLMIKRVGGHEAWGAIRSAEVGDGTYECTSAEEIAAMIKLMQCDGDILSCMCGHILTAKKAGIYNGAYKVIELAVNHH